ncbi:MAG: iron-sulfur cluster carrier protein ApbC [Zoogloeaceae bacterium]|jgi:ATP-binding protein involved in chromosome partitioning|nr:iron-sulfur cluster carrier protein ApbC [Zoogloeaceae bacterium]
MSLTVDSLRTALARVTDPNTGLDFVSGKAVRDLRFDDGAVRLTLEVGYPAKSQSAPLRALVEQALRSVPGVNRASVAVTSRIQAHAPQRGVKRLPGVKNVIAIASGKGGVGKSTTAVNLALALTAEGARVGLLDADLYGPSQPLMLGLSGQTPGSPDGKGMEPLVAHGLEVMSIAFLAGSGEDTPMIWRGPLAARALEQLLAETHWHDLDYLFVDMPPGTGDIPLTLAQKAPVTGVALVTTPQDIALLDVKKGLRMFEKTGIALLGVVENMSVHVCPNCGHAEHIFGSGGAERLCADYGVPFLGSLPLDIHIREQSDDGLPTVVAAPDSEAAQRYRAAALAIAGHLTRLPVDHNSRIPPVVRA